MRHKRKVSKEERDHEKRPRRAGDGPEPKVDAREAPEDAPGKLADNCEIPPAADADITITMRWTPGAERMDGCSVATKEVGTEILTQPNKTATVEEKVSR